MHPGLPLACCAALSLALACTNTTPLPADPDPREAGPSAARTDAAADAAPADVVPDTAPAACPEPLVHCNTLRPLPPTIKQAGFFPAAPDLATLPAGVHPFEPDWPLWSNGLAKSRQIIVPRGLTVAIGDRQAWQFPPGTLFLKTFLADRPGGGQRPIETRIIRRVEDADPFKQWQYAVYRWNEAASDATLLDLEERVPVMVTVGNDSFVHQIPSRMDCGKCHAANDTVVIGFDELRLNWTPRGQASTELARMHALGLLDRPPPPSPAALADPDPDLRQLKGQLLGNCVHCHDGRNSNVFDMRPEVLVANLVCQPTTSNGTLEGLRVAPGQPEQSILYLQLARVMRPGINPMPPVGVERPDPAALALARRWITNLKSSCPSP